MKIIFVTLLMIIGLSPVFAQSNANFQASLASDFDALKNESNPKILQQKINRLTHSKNEKDWITVIHYYDATGQLNRKESLENELFKRFPHGNYALFNALVHIKYGKNGDAMEKILAKMKTNFPHIAVSDLDGAENMIAIQYAEERNTVRSLLHLNRIKIHPSVLIIANDLLKYDAAAAAKVVKQAMDRNETMPADSGNKAMYNQFCSLYSKIQIKLGHNEEALRYAKIAYDDRSGDDVSDGVASYAYLLSTNGQYREALPILRKLFIAGESNEQLNDRLRLSYEKLNPGKDGKVYLAGIQDSLINALEEDLTKTMLNDKAPDFYVTDSSGKKVSLSDFKGKTVILDFWATWCAPCKASFPAMQLAVNKYKNDPQVKFLFIHTRETSTTPLADAKNYLLANDYHLPLYMDIKAPLTHTNPAFSALNLQFIPAKLVIDGNGVIRFQLIGFGAEKDEAHVNILSAMIELAKKSS
ncbi:TlpA family protein disulfide reductase [Mucilaginibacter jinjuensis]|uniref:Redoxin domain-containing protein n=1 Tax=Mucilaginibacter jinjuensis TaxID=1176721 RepID=A0ABY7T9T9_9SPHI|nr:redoxin domain-containing protein [Mucilaginibacter jinjuensis]WCT13265.1 redoxin domain-containing protein [Mucilaginibacter jinjuensis]